MFSIAVQKVSAAEGFVRRPNAQTRKVGAAERYMPCRRTMRADRKVGSADRCVRTVKVGAAERCMRTGSQTRRIYRGRVPKPKAETTETAEPGYGRRKR